MLSLSLIYEPNKLIQTYVHALQTVFPTTLLQQFKTLYCVNKPHMYIVESAIHYHSLSNI